MTDEELINLAKEFATTEMAVNPAWLENSRVIEAAVIRFKDDEEGRVTIILNRETGALISGEVAPGEKLNRA